MKSTNDEEDTSDYGDDDSSTEEHQMHEPQSFVHYCCHDEVVDKWRRGKVLSGMLSEGKLYVCHRFGARSLLMQFMTVDESAFFSFGLWYYELRCCHDVDDDEKGSLQDVMVDCYALLLPLPSCEGPNQKYALMTSNWRTWDGRTNVVQPYHLRTSSD